MSQKQRIWIALVALFLFLVGATSWGDSDPDEMECLPEQSSEIYLGEEELSPKGSSGVPRNQILLEVFMRPT